MALFKILEGPSSRIDLETTPFHHGWAYFTPDDGGLYIDTEVDGEQKRIRVATGVVLDIDTSPTKDSKKAVSSGGVYTAMEGKADLEDGRVKTDQLPENLITSDDEEFEDVGLLLDADTLGGHSANYFATQEEVKKKQDKLSGGTGMIVGFDRTGAAIALDPSRPGVLTLNANTLGGHDASYFATQEEVADKATKEEVAGKATKEEVALKASKDEVALKASQEDVAKKQDKLSGKAGQVVGFDASGNAIAQAAPVTGITQTDADARYLQKSAITYGTQDMTEGVSALATGSLYVVYVP